MNNIIFILLLLAILVGIVIVYILKYKPGEDIGIDDVEIEEDFINED